MTSWASFSFDIKLGEECVSKQVLHLPCMEMPDIWDVAIVFKPRPGQLAMIYFAKRATPAKLTGAGSVLGAPVDKGIFPNV